MGERKKSIGSKFFFARFAREIVSIKTLHGGHR